MAEVSKVDDLLKKLGIYLGKQRTQRYQLASKIAASGVRFDETIATALMQQAQRLGANNPAAMILSWIQTPEEIEAFVAEIETSQEFAAGLGKGAGRQEASNIGGKLELASADNPYGWTDPGGVLRRYKDTNVPGKWNPWRQSYNLTVEQARARNRQNDFKRKRCSCLEIVSKADTKAEIDRNIKRWESNPEWDAVEVEKALGKNYGEPDYCNPVYGEQP